MVQWKRRKRRFGATDAQSVSADAPILSVVPLAGITVGMCAWPLAAQLLQTQTILTELLCFFAFASRAATVNRAALVKHRRAMITIKRRRRAAEQLDERSDDPIGMS